MAEQTTSDSGENLSRQNEKTKQDTSDISDGDDQFNKWGLGVFPIIFYSDETRGAGGAGVTCVKKTKSKNNSSTIGIIGFYTQNDQYVFQFVPNIYLKQGAYILSAEISLSYFPDKFYGTSNNTSKDDEEDYTARRFFLMPSIQKRLYPNLYAGVQYDYSYDKITKTETGKLLDSGTIPGSMGGISSGIGLLASWDTRDDNLYPAHGSYHLLSVKMFNPALGSDFTYNSYLLNLRHYELIFKKHILALQSIVSIKTGNPPFLALNQLGVYLRGYYQSRFEDKNLAAFQAEYRLPLFWRFGLVGFAGFGQVTDKKKNFSFKELKPSAGFGVRFAIIPAQKVNLRIDWGFGKGDSSFDISLLELF